MACADGYDVAKIHNSRLTYVSPVWLQVRRSESGGVHITGTHDIDSAWVQHVRSCDDHPDTCPLVVPRVILEAGKMGKETEVRAGGCFGSYVLVASR